MINKTKKTLIILLLLVLILAGTFIATSAGVENGVILWLNPAYALVNTGTSSGLTLQLDSATNVYGIQLEMTFDPAVINVVGSTLTPGSCPAPDFVLYNTADNGTGDISYVVTQLSPTAPCNGGDVAEIEITCVAPGETTVSITSSIISDPNGLPIPHTTQNGSVYCGDISAVYLPMINK